MTAVSAPDPQTLVVETDVPNPLILQAYVPILPKHIWASTRSRRSATRRRRTTSRTIRRSSGPARTRPSSGCRASSSASPATRTTGAKQGAADEVIIQHFASGDTMVQALKTGDIDYVRGVLADQFNALKTEPDIATVEGVANGYTELTFNTGGNKEGYGGSTVGARPTPPSATRSATRSTSRRSSTGRSAATARPAPRSSRRSTRAGTSIPTTPASSTSKRRRAASMPPATSSTASGKRLDKEGNVINLRLTWPDSEAENATNAQFIAEWFGELGITVTPGGDRGRQAHRRRHRPAERPGRTTTSTCGAGSATRIRTRCSASSRPRRSAARATATTRTREYDELYNEQRAGVRRGEAQGDPGRDAEPRLRRGAVPHPLLRRRAARLPDRQVRRLDEPARRGRHAALRLRLGGYNEADRPRPGRAPSPPASGAVSVSGRSGATPAPSAAAARRPSRQLDTMLPLILGIGALVVIIAVGLIVMRGRRGRPKRNDRRGRFAAR